MPRPSRRSFVSLALAAGCLAGVAAGCDKGKGDPSRVAAAMDNWDVQELADRLNARGVALHVTPTAKYGTAERSAFLTETERPWEELNRLPASRESVGAWKGVVLCEKPGARQTTDSRVEVWGDACLDRPPFLFFGDPELRARIDQALEEEAGGP
jgi:hypothetical protein